MFLGVSWWFCMVIYGFRWFLMVLGGSWKFSVVLGVLGECWWFLEFLGGS